MVMLVWPSELVDVIESMPAIVENCFSSGVATEEAIVSGLAPGNEALTKMVGKSTLGRSLTGSSWYANTPNIRMAAMTSVVMTGRSMNSCDSLTVSRPSHPYLFYPPEPRASHSAHSLLHPARRVAGRSQLRVRRSSAHPRLP